jgi:hypothetical protein
MCAQCGEIASLMDALDRALVRGGHPLSSLTAVVQEKKMDFRQHYSSLRNTATQESDGIVVWDHIGLVVVWPDGHHSRFSWAGLRQMCCCAECQHLQQQHDGSRDHRYDNQETAVEV